MHDKLTINSMQKSQEWPPLILNIFFNLYPQWDTAVEYEIFIDKLIVQKATWGVWYACLTYIFNYLVSVSHV